MSQPSEPSEDDTSSLISNDSVHIAIVGGGITGACVAWKILQGTLSEHPPRQVRIHVDLYDQGRNGPGGRASQRTHTLQLNDDENTAHQVAWDHGCQFFRGDTVRFQTEFLHEWLERGWVQEYQGHFGFVPSLQPDSTSSSTTSATSLDFFGFPRQPPFYIGVGGMKHLVQHMIHQLQTDFPTQFTLYPGHRVARLSPSPNDNSDHKNQWTLYGTTGIAAYHDTKESTAQQTSLSRLSEHLYDAVVLTDASSSSLGAWHRASAGVPNEFGEQVRHQVGSRTPLMTAMVAVDATHLPHDALVWRNHPVLWFASKNNSKPGFASLSNGGGECWTLISTPQFALQEIATTPMQNEQTGEFIPQSPDYLTKVVGPALVQAFGQYVREQQQQQQDTTDHNDNSNDNDNDNGTTTNMNNLPFQVLHLDAQRWGSALPSAQPLSSPTRRTLCGVDYDLPMETMAPTQRLGDGPNYVADAELGLFQAGDMVSCYTPGLEGAALSGLDVAEQVISRIWEEHTE